MKPRHALGKMFGRKLSIGECMHLLIQPVELAAVLDKDMTNASKKESVKNIMNMRMLGYVDFVNKKEKIYDKK